MSVSAPAEVVAPAFCHIPAYRETLGPEVAQLCELAGYAPDPEQRLALDAIFALDPRDPLSSAAFETAVICARQNMKTGLFKQAALGWLLVVELNLARLIVWSAHEFRTAQEAFRDMDQLLAGTPALARRVRKVYAGNGDEAVEMRDGRRLIFKARTKTGGRGLSGSKVVLDEAFALAPEHLGALLPTLSVQPDPQLVYGSSAGLASSSVLRGIRDRGRPGLSPQLAYLEWASKPGGCAHPECDHVVGTEGCALDDEERWRDANPLLGRTRANGTGLTAEYVRAERQALPASEFARERMGWWDEPGAAAVFGLGRWEACLGERPDGLTLGGLAVAVSYDQTAAAIGAGGLDGDTVHVRPLEHRPGTRWLAGRVRELQDQFGVAVMVDPRGPAADMIPVLREAEVRVEELSTTDVLDSCAGLFRAVVERRLQHEGYPELEAAVSAAVRRPVGERWAWGRRHSTGDISVLEAVTLAAFAAARTSESEPWGVFL